MKTPADGDDFLSGQDRYLWSLCYSTLQRFGCLTMFKRMWGDPRNKVNHVIQFFVPVTHDRAKEVKQYIEEELRHEARAPAVIDEQWIAGTSVYVYYFSGIDGFLTHEEMAPLIEKAAESLFEKLEARKRTVQ